MDSFKNFNKVVINTLKMLKERGYNTNPYEKFLTDDKLVELYHKDDFELIIQPLKKILNTWIYFMFDFRFIANHHMMI